MPSRRRWLRCRLPSGRGRWFEAKQNRGCVSTTTGDRQEERAPWGRSCRERCLPADPAPPASAVVLHMTILLLKVAFGHLLCLYLVCSLDPFARFAASLQQCGYAQRRNQPSPRILQGSNSHHTPLFHRRIDALDAARGSAEEGTTRSSFCRQNHFPHEQK